MSLTKKIITFAAPVALLSLAACATPFRADVARFQAMPAPQGQTFVVQPIDPRDQGGLEFAQYAAMVSQRLAAQGYQPAPDAKRATLVVSLGYGVDNGQEKITTRPGFGWGRPWGYGPWGRWGGYRSSFYWGWHDPFWSSPWDYPEVESYTVFTSFLDLDIKRTADGQSVFEGHAKARSRDDNLTRLVPNLVEAMFTNFPGNSGETVKITIPPPPRNS